MALTVKSPCWGDSDSVLIWKYAVNLYLAASAVDSSLPVPRLGSPDNDNWALALLYANTLS